MGWFTWFLCTEKNKFKKCSAFELSNKYNIHRTRIGFSKPIDNFESMAEKGLKIIDKVVTEKYLGEIKNNKWILNFLQDTLAIMLLTHQT